MAAGKKVRLMKVRMKVLGSGPSGTLKPGSEVVVSDEHGQELIDGGYAEEVPEPEAEEAEVEAGEPGDGEGKETADPVPGPENEKAPPKKRSRTKKTDA